MTKLHQAKTIVEFLQENVQDYADKVAFTCQGESITYQQLDQRSTVLASWLQHQTPLEQGDRIAIQLPNCLAYPIIVYAAFKAGLVIVNTNPMYTPREMQHQFTDAGVKALFILDALSPKLAGFVNDTDIQNIIGIGGNSELAKLGESAQASSHEFSAILTSGNSAALKPLQVIEENEIALLQYTGGTTGVSKGASLTHKSLLSNVNQIGQHFGDKLTEGEEAFVTPLPLYHIYAFCGKFTLRWWYWRQQYFN